MSIIGTTINWGEDQPVEIPASERRRHVYVIGQTGTGKSTLLRNLMLQDIDEGRGVGFIDPHGDVAEELLDCIPPHRVVVRPLHPHSLRSCVDRRAMGSAEAKEDLKKSAAKDREVELEKIDKMP